MHLKAEVGRASEDSSSSVRPATEWASGSQSHPREKRTFVHRSEVVVDWWQQAPFTVLQTAGQRAPSSVVCMLCERWLSWGNPIGGVLMKRPLFILSMQNPLSCFDTQEGPQPVQTLVLDSSALKTIKQIYDCCLSITQFVAFLRSSRKWTIQGKTHSTEWGKKTSLT